MVLIVITQEIENEPFLVNELNEIAPQFQRVIVVTTEKDYPLNQKFEIVISKRRDYFLPSILYAFRKLFSKEFFAELKRRKKLRVVPSISSMVYNCILAWMIEKRLSSYVSKIGIDENTVLYSYWLNIYAYFVAKTKKKHPKIIALSRAHSFEISDFDVYIPFRKTIDSYLDKIIFISNYTRKEYESLMKNIHGKQRAEQKVIYLGVKKSDNSDSIRNYKNRDVFTIVSCSGIHHRKRLDLLIDSLAATPETVSLNWVHFGSGSDFSTIRAYAEKKLTRRNLTYEFKGQAVNAEVLKYYESNQVDLFINTSNYEGIPVSIMEAMSNGIPCIARNVGGNNEIVIDNITGKLVPIDVTPNQLAEVIQYFYDLSRNYPEKNVELRESTYNYWLKNFNSANNYRDFLNYILKRTN